MRISFSPIRSDASLVLEKSQGDRLRINGELFNFKPLPDGATIPAGAVPCDMIVGPVERIDGEVRLTLLLPHGPNPSEAVAYPEAITVTEDGPVDAPFDEPAGERTVEEESADVDA